MEEERDLELNEAEAEAEEKYEPRPLWQVWAARLGLVLFGLFVIYQLLTIAGGGL